MELHSNVPKKITFLSGDIASVPNPTKVDKFS